MKDMTTYFIFENKDKTESGLCPDWNYIAALEAEEDRFNVVIVHKFEAESWDDAKKIYHEFMGFEKVTE